VPSILIGIGRGPGNSATCSGTILLAPAPYYGAVRALHPDDPDGAVLGRGRADVHQLAERDPDVTVTLVLNIYAGASGWLVDELQIGS
jgi:hypothetical protein